MTDAELVPLSYAQERLWYLSRLFPGGAAYTLTRAFRVRGPLDVAALEAALGDLTARHDVLRTTFPAVNGRPVALIRAPQPVRIDGIPAASGPPEDAAAAAQPISADLSAGPLFLPSLLRIAPDDHILILAFHHIIVDGWSLSLLYRELSARYADRLDGTAPPDQPSRVRYRHYAAWQRRWTRDTGGQRAMAHCLDRLAGAPHVLALPSDRPRPAAQSGRGAGYRFPVRPGLWDAIGVLARAHRCTRFAVLAAGWAALMSRLSGQRDLVIGTVTADRPRPEFEGIVGLFVDTVPIRMDLTGDPAFGLIVDRARAAILDALDNRVPFDALVAAVGPERSAAHNPLVQVMIALDADPGGDLRLRRTRTQPLDLPAATAKADLTLAIEQHPAGGSHGELEYSTDLFDAAEAARITGRFTRLAEAAVADPDLPLSKLPLLLDDELTADDHQIGLEPVHDTLPKLLEQAAGHAPSQAAVACGSAQLSHGMLHDQADALARRLQRLGAKADGVVAVACERGTHAAVAVLAVLKSGAAYLPVSPDTPHQRVRRLMAGCGTRIIVTTRQAAGRLAGIAGEYHLIYADDVPQDAGARAGGLNEAIHPDQLAYVIYTSGSTGTPKPVAVSHGSLAAHARAVRDVFGLRADDRVLQFASLAFDVAAEELFPTWLAGAAAVPLPEQVADPAALAVFCQAQGITVVNLPSSYWRLWIGDIERGGANPPPCLRLAVIGSEPADSASAVRWHKLTGIPLINAYGVTEATITSAVHVVGHAAGPPGTVPIGHPLPGTTARVLDSYLNRTPRGSTGELYLGGSGLARGYLGRPDLTAERFVPDPFSARGERLYRTGDVAHRDSAGKLHHDGRIDRQVKIHGHRIEPAEIEAVLTGHPAVREATVHPHTDEAGRTSLIAYLVLADAGAPGAGQPGGIDPVLRRTLESDLPVHLRPRTYVVVPELPRTPGGKIDCAGLPAPRQAIGARVYRRPSSATERALSRIYADVLHVDRVGLDDNVFDLGGNSLLLAAAHIRMTQALRPDLPLLALLEHPTVAELARQIDDPADQSLGTARPARPARNAAGHAVSRARPAPASRNSRERDTDHERSRRQR